MKWYEIAALAVFTLGLSLMAGGAYLLLNALAN